MVPAQRNWACNLSFSDCIVNRCSDLCASLGVRIQDPCLRAHNHLVLFCLLDPQQVIGELSFHPWRCVCHQPPDHSSSNFVCRAQIVWMVRQTDPSEGAKTERKNISHDLLDVRRVDKAFLVGRHDICSCAAGFKQEAVSVVPELHPFRHALCHSSTMPSQAALHKRFELRGVFVHQFVGLFKSQAGRVIPPVPRVVERGLVAAQLC
mmetsp:Transcript_13318/g.25868  ORF Transcript_13318/g.25868 Transcript_13318/m.25868 type:complete len:207 (-) Transcript_13318:1039-1659(-)